MEQLLSEQSNLKINQSSQSQHVGQIDVPYTQHNLEAFYLPILPTYYSYHLSTCVKCLKTLP